jgi:hypothetical protein
MAQERLLENSQRLVLIISNGKVELEYAPRTLHLAAYWSNLTYGTGIALAKL